MRAKAGDQPAWTWKGGGIAEAPRNAPSAPKARRAAGAGEEATLDAWIPTVRIIVRGDADTRSTGRLVRIERAIVYEPRR